MGTPPLHDPHDTHRIAQVGDALREMERDGALSPGELALLRRSPTLDARDLATLIVNRRLAGPHDAPDTRSPGSVLVDTDPRGRAPDDTSASTPDRAPDEPSEPDPTP